MDLCTHLNVLSFAGVVLLNCCIEEVPHAFNFRVLNNHINSSKLRAAYVGVEPGLGLIYIYDLQMSCITSGKKKLKVELQH